MEKAIAPVPANTAEVTRRFLELKIPGTADRTVIEYANDRRQYAGFCEEHKLSLGDVESVKTFRADLRRTGYRPASINRKLGAIKRSLFEYTKREYGLGEAHALRSMLREAKAIPIAKGERRVTREKVLTREEINAIAGGAPERIALMVRFLAATGARVSEMLGVRLSDVKAGAGCCTVGVVGKGGKARTLKAPCALLDRARELYQGKQWLFESEHGNPYSREYVTREIARAGRRVLDKRVSAHTLRHSFATQMIAETRKVQAVSEYLGHASVATTLDLYVHESLTVEELLHG